MEIISKNLLGNTVDKEEIGKLILENPICTNIISTVIKTVTEEYYEE